MIAVSGVVPNRRDEAVGAIHQALMRELPDDGDGPPRPGGEPGAGARAVHFGLAMAEACAGFPADEIAIALATQDERTLCAVAGGIVTRLVSPPTAIAI
jgi:hypothetical protein